MPLWPSVDTQAEQALLALARWAIDRQLRPNGSVKPALSDSVAGICCGCFVTLEQQGQLRGCIGTLNDHQPLAQIVPDLACQAAFHDHRFDPLTASEWPDVSLAISLLGPAQPIACASQQELEEQLVVGRDGLILDDGQRSATFLPMVWRHLSDPHQFVGQLLIKGHWSRWPAQMQAWRYASQSFSDDNRVDRS